MITNRDEVLENAFRVFARMNYEKASQTEIAKACGLSKAGLIYYYPFKQDLFVAVVDKYVFQAQHPQNKFTLTSFTLDEFIHQYIAGVKTTMQQMVALLDDGDTSGGCSPNFYYFHLLMQVRLHYPNVEAKLKNMSDRDYELWTTAIRQAQQNGEIRRDLDTAQTASVFHRFFLGLSFEQSFFVGLNTDELSRQLHFIYSTLKA
ncbi:MAG: TetR/AcrR family transcriptional regulator [Parabacteroides sp.]|nr:TetR/AcrR family transcriptional regulator [Parabacteroides sp.]